VVSFPLPPPPSAPLSPYTTLFRSWSHPSASLERPPAFSPPVPLRPSWRCAYPPFGGILFRFAPLSPLRPYSCIGLRKGAYGRKRSEEHTSELQSRFDLVCRLLLEK